MIHDIIDIIAGQEVTEAIIVHEAKRSTGSNPRQARKIKPHPTRPGLSTWSISFTENLNTRFRLFENSSLAKIRENRARIIQCDRCWDFHPRHTCHRPIHCNKCSGPAHDGECDHCCINCHGPHEADERSCPARPIRLNGALKYKTKNELRVTQAAGAALRLSLQAKIDETEDADLAAEEEQAEETRTRTEDSPASTTEEDEAMEEADQIGEPLPGLDQSRHAGTEETPPQIAAQGSERSRSRKRKESGSAAIAPTAMKQARALSIAQWTTLAHTRDIDMENQDDPQEDADTIIVANVEEN
jgi:hypothetical protein